MLPNPSVRRLSDDLIRDARKLFEVDGLPLRVIARQFNVPHPSLHYWMERQKWTRPEGWVQHVGRPSKQQVSAFAKTLLNQSNRDAEVAYDETLAGLLEGKAKRAENKRKRAAGTVGKPGPKPKPKTIPNPPSASAPEKIPTHEAVPNSPEPAKPSPPENPAETAGLAVDPPPTKTAKIVAFPGGKMPPAPPPKTIDLLLPRRTAQDAQMAKQRMAVLRAVMTETQVSELEKHMEVLRDYHHLIQLYLNPQSAIGAELEGMEEEKVIERVTSIQRAAMSIMLPTPADSLQGAIKQLTASLMAVITMQRTVMQMGLTASKKVRPEDLDSEPVDDEGKRRQQIATMEVGKLRQVKQAMEYLIGVRQVAAEPPKPPLPDPLDDK